MNDNTFKQFQRRVYTMGYSGKSLDDIEKTAVRLDAVIFDIRFSPRSRRKGFSRKGLSERLGSRYQHVRGFGNVNYKTAGAPIVLHDYEAAKAILDTLAQNVILLCVCGDFDTCHRSTLVNKLLHDGYDVAGEIGPRQSALL